MTLGPTGRAAAQRMSAAIGSTFGFDPTLILMIVTTVLPMLFKGCGGDDNTPEAQRSRVLRAYDAQRHRESDGRYSRSVLAGVVKRVKTAEARERRDMTPERRNEVPKMTSDDHKKVAIGMLDDIRLGDKKEFATAWKEVNARMTPEALSGNLREFGSMGEES